MNEQFEFKSAANGQISLDQAEGIVECFVAGIGNKDSVGDIVVTGAFAKSLTRRKPRVVWAHSWNDPIGKVLEMYEVPPGDPRLPAKMRNAGIGGLYAKVQFNLQSEKGKEAFASVAFFGEEQEWSIGYKTITGAFDPAQQANVLKEVELYEVSPVLHGANQLTGTISVKSEQKNHMMPVIAGMPMMGEQQQPRMIVIAAPEKEQEQDEPFNIFAEGLAQPLEVDKVQKIQAELSERTGSKVDIVEATDSFIVFRRTTTDGKVSMYRVGYHTPDGYNTFMFGKPEAYSGNDNKPQMQQEIEVKPADTSMVPMQPQQIPYRDDDQDEMNTMLGGQVGVGKSAYAHLIEIPQIHMVQAKSMLQPVFNYHKLSTTDSDNGIIVNGSISAQAIDALQNAVKAIGQTIGQSVGNLRTLAQSFNPYAIDGDNDGFAQDGTAFQRPYIPIKRPDTDLPEVGGKKRNSSELLDKPTIRTGKKPKKDPSLLQGQERQEALAAGELQPRTMDDISFLANRRPENEGLAKYWDMSEEGLRAEGQKLVAARRGQTGSAREATDGELFKISHEFSRREAYKNQFGKEFVPPKRTESTGRETFDYRDLEATDEMIRPAGREFTGYNPFIEKEKEKQRALAQWSEAIAEYEKGRSKRGFSSRGDVAPEQQNRIDASRKRGADIASGRAQILADNLKNLSDEDKDTIREEGIVSFLLQDGTGGPLSGEWAGDSPAERIGDLLPEGDWSTDSKLQADAEDIFASYEEGFYGQLDKEFADLVNPADLETEKSRWDGLSANEQDSILEQGRDSARGLASRNIDDYSDDAQSAYYEDRVNKKRVRELQEEFGWDRDEAEAALNNWDELDGVDADEFDQQNGGDINAAIYDAWETAQTNRENSRGFRSRGETASEGQRPPRTAVAMQMDPKNSKLARQIDYDPQNGDLTVYYRDGKKETFNDVPYDRVRKAGTDDKPDALISALQREQKKPQSRSGFASRNVNAEGSGLWGTNRPLDPDDPELSDGYIEDYVHDYVFEGGNFDFEDLVKYNRRKTVSDEELQKLYDDYLSDDTKISDEAADTIERTFFNEIVDDNYDAMLEQYRSRFDYYDEDDGFASRGLPPSLQKPTPVEELEDFKNFLDREYGDYFMDYTQMDDEELKKTLMKRYAMTRSEANATTRQIRKHENKLDDLTDAMVAAEDAGFASLSRIKPGRVRGIVDDGPIEEINLDDEFVNDLIYDDESRELFVSVGGGWKKGEPAADGSITSTPIPRRTYILQDVSKEELNELGSSRNLGESVNALEKIKTSRDSTEDDKFNFYGREDNFEGVETRLQLEKLLLEEKYKAKKAKKVAEQARLDLSDDEFIADLLPRPSRTGRDSERTENLESYYRSLMKMSPSELEKELEEARNTYYDAKLTLDMRDGRPMGFDEEAEGVSKKRARAESVERILVRKTQSGDGKADGFASLGKWRPDDVNELLDSDENLRSEIEQAYFRNNPGTPRPGSRDYDPQDAYDDFESNPEKYGYAKDFRKQAIEALKGNGADKDEAERVADYWIENDGIHEEYLKEADGDSLYAMALAYDNYIDAAADDYNERQRGFGSGGRERGFASFRDGMYDPDSDPYFDFDDREPDYDATSDDEWQNIPEKVQKEIIDDIREYVSKRDKSGKDNVAQEADESGNLPIEITDESFILEENGREYVAKPVTKDEDLFKQLIESGKRDWRYRNVSKEDLFKSFKEWSDAVSEGRSNGLLTKEEADTIDEELAKIKSILDNPQSNFFNELRDSRQKIREITTNANKRSKALNTGDGNNTRFRHMQTLDVLDGGPSALRILEESFQNERYKGQKSSDGKYEITEIEDFAATLINGELEYEVDDDGDTRVRPERLWWDEFTKFTDPKSNFVQENQDLMRPYFRNGFASRGGEMQEMRPYGDLTSKEKEDLYETIQDYLNGRGDWARIQNELAEGGFDYDDFLEQNPEFHPDFADFGDAGDMGFASRGSSQDGELDIYGFGKPVKINKDDDWQMSRFNEIDRQSQQDFIAELEADDYFADGDYDDADKLSLAADEWNGRGLEARERYTDEMLGELYELENVAETNFTDGERRGESFEGSAFAYVEEIIKNPLSTDFSDYEEARKRMDGIRSSLQKRVLQKEKNQDDANTLGEEDFGFGSRGDSGSRSVEDFENLGYKYGASFFEDTDLYERASELGKAKGELTTAIDEAENMLDGLDEDSPEWERLFNAQQEMSFKLWEIEDMMEEMVTEKDRLDDAQGLAATLTGEANDLVETRRGITRPSAEDLDELSFEDANYEYTSLMRDITYLVDENSLSVDWNEEKQSEIEKALRDGDYEKAEDMLYDVTQEIWDTADDIYRTAEAEYDDYPFLDEDNGFASRGGSRFDTMETPYSSAIEAVHYDRNTRELHVAFKPGQTGGEARYYTYSGVSPDYFDNEISGSNSIGRVINDVKKNYDVEVTNPKTVDAINGRGEVVSAPGKLGPWSETRSRFNGSIVAEGDDYYYRVTPTADGTGRYTTSAMSKRSYSEVDRMPTPQPLEQAKAWADRHYRENTRATTPVGGRSEIQDIDVRRSAALYESYYDPNTEELVVTFKDKDGNAAGSYIYEGVTADEANELASASSKGKVINRLKASKSVRRAGADDRMERTPGAADEVGSGGYEAQVDSHWDKIGPDEQRAYFARAVDSAINAGTGTSADEITADAKARAYDDRQIAMMEMQAEKLGMGYRKIDVGSSAALNRVEYDPDKRELRVEYRGRDGKGNGEFYVYQNVPQSVVDDIEASDSRGATLRRVRDDFEFRTESAIPESAFYSMGDAGNMGERSNPKITNRTNANGFYLDENGRATNYNKRSYTTADIQKINGRRNGRDGFASAGYTNSQFSKEDLEKILDRFRQRPEFQEWMEVQDELESRMRRFDSPRSRYPELDKEEARLDKIANAARQQVIEELLAEGDISLRDVATPKPSSPFGMERDGGFASRGSINESSTGQRIVPSRMHSDDREALAEITDPEERKQRIDELIEFYGPRIFAKPSKPKRKKIVLTQDENGYWVGPDGKPSDFNFSDDGFASRGGTSKLDRGYPYSIDVEKPLEEENAIAGQLMRTNRYQYIDRPGYDPTPSVMPWTSLSPSQKERYGENILRQNQEYFDRLRKNGASSEEIDDEIAKIHNEFAKGELISLERTLKMAKEDFYESARRRMEQANPGMSQNEIEDMLFDLGLSENDFDKLFAKNMDIFELATVADELESKRRDIVRIGPKEDGLASGGVDFDRYGNLPSRPKKPRKTSDPSLRNTPKNRAMMTAERRLAEMANSGDTEYDSLMLRAKEALSKEGVPGYQLSNEYGEPNSLVARKMQEILAADILKGSTPKTGGDRPKVDPLSILGGYSDGDVFGLTPRGFASRGASGSKKKTKEEVYAEMTKQLIDALSESEKLGKWQLPWRRMGLPENGTTGHKYSGSNWFFLTAMTDIKGYNSNKWATYDQWQGIGGQVRKGEKATSIFVPIFLKGREKADGTEEKGTIRFISRSVFNLDQIDGLPEDFDKKEILPESERVADLEKTISEIPAVIKNGGDEAYFSPSEDFIQLPLFENFRDARAYYSTAAHELMHWTGGKDRLGRENMNRFGTPEYAYEELVAEIASAMFMAAHNIEPNIQENHGPYLASWIKKLKDDPTALERAMKDAQSAVNYILNISPNAKSKFSNGERTEFENPDIAVPTEPVVAVEGFASRGDWPTPGGYEPGEFDMRTALSQIGRGNLMAISGTRAKKRNNEMVLPVNRNQQVIVGYDGGSDTYFVRAEQIITNGKDKGKTRVLGQWDNVYADELGETAYQASLKPSMLSDENKTVWAQAFDHPQTGSLLDENGQVYENGLASGGDSMDPDELDAMDWAYDAAQDYLMEQEDMMPEEPSPEDGFASRMNLSTPEKNEIISIARGMNTPFTRSVVAQYDRNGELSDRQWDALNRMTLRGNRSGFPSRGGDKRPRTPKARWSPEDRQRYADGDRLRSKKRPGKRRNGPDASEYGFGSRGADNRPSIDMIESDIFFEGERNGRSWGFEPIISIVAEQFGGRKNMSNRQLAKELGVSEAVAEKMRKPGARTSDIYLLDDLRVRVAGSDRSIWGPNNDPLAYYDESGKPITDYDKIPDVEDLAPDAPGTRAPKEGGARTYIDPTAVFEEVGIDANASKYSIVRDNSDVFNRRVWDRIMTRGITEDEINALLKAKKSSKRSTDIYTPEQLGVVKQKRTDSMPLADIFKNQAFDSLRGKRGFPQQVAEAITEITGRRPAISTVKAFINQPRSSGSQTGRNPFAMTPAQIRLLLDNLGISAEEFEKFRSE